METKKAILIVYNYNRYDFLKYFDRSKDYVNLYFAEFTSPLEEKNNEYLQYGQALYWGSYRDVYHLLNKIKPDKVLFHYIESKFHILLNVACQQLGIPTFIIDHGIRDLNINIRLNNYFTSKADLSGLAKYKTIIAQFSPRLKARLFFLRSLARMPENERSAIQAYLNTKSCLISPVTIPNAYIVISEKSYECHRILSQLRDDQKYYIIGIPAFDNLAAIQPAPAFKNSLIYIDQGLASTGYFGWTPENYQIFQEELISICQSSGLQLYVKPHPRQPTATWQKTSSNQQATIINDEELTALLPYTQVIIGFMSTYLLPLAALPHTVIITFENHPIGRLDVSKSFIDAGVAHPVYSMHELKEALQKLVVLHKQQLPNKAAFAKQWLYKFDGKSGDRLKEILLS